MSLSAAFLSGLVFPFPFYTWLPTVDLIYYGAKAISVASQLQFQITSFYIPNIHFFPPEEHFFYQRSPQFLLKENSFSYKWKNKFEQFQKILSLRLKFCLINKVLINNSSHSVNIH